MVARRGRSEAGVALPAILQILATVVAPTTLITALLFYYGRLHAQGLTRYLRVQFTVLDLTAQDYLVRSADGLFVPLAMALVAVVAALWAHRLLMRAGSRRRVLAVVIPMAAALGLLGVAISLLVALDTVAVAGMPEIGGLALSVGVALLAYAVQLGRGPRESSTPWPTGTTGASTRASGLALAEWGAIFVLFSVGLFWAVNSYALAVGTSRGEEIERGLPSAPDVVLYSEKSLGLQLPGVREVRCAPALPSTDVAYRFRYEGLKLVLQSGGQYLFLPAGWSRADGQAVLVPRSNALRLEFGPPGQSLPPAC